MIQNINDRFWSKVDRNGPVQQHCPELGQCWIWTARRTPKGYGSFRLDDREQSAHRVAWTLTHGAVPDGLCVLHRCDNRACVRPDHLILGTVADNNRDMAQKGRAGTRGERNGSAKLSPADVQQIRLLRAQGQTVREIAVRFGISKTQAGDVLRGKYWRQVESHAPARPLDLFDREAA